MLNFPSFFNAQVGGYEIEQSLRFDGSSHLSLAATGSGGSSNFTLSVWVKLTKNTGTNGCIFGGSGYGSNAQGLFLGDPNSKLSVAYNWGINGTGQISNALFRDPSAWYHLVMKVAGTNLDLYINNEEVSLSQDQSYSTNNFNSSSVARLIGAVATNSPSDKLNGYLAEFHFVDGSSLNPSSFGEPDDNGVWRPIAYTGSHGTNGFYLTFDPSATNGIGHDHSGNGNNWTASGFTTSGTGTDVMSDTPTTNWCTLNPLATSGAPANSLSNGNLQAQHTLSSYGANFATFAIPSSGKWYFEVTYQSVGSAGTNQIFGIATSDESKAFLFDSPYLGSGLVQSDGVNDTSVGAATAGDVYGLAVDCDLLSATMYRNGSTLRTYSMTPGEVYFPYFRGYNSGISQFNFGQRAFAYTPPTGFKALNTSNLSAPTVKDGSQYFDTKLYTGSGGSQSLTGLGFQPELVWIKARTTASSHGLYDAVRGVGKVLLSNSPSAEQNYGSYGVTSFDAAGFSVNDLPGYGVNDSGYTYAAWCWDAGGTGSSNTDGDITSTVSANPSAGFSIATYTGNGTAGATVGHGLGVAPRMIIVKQRSGATDWQIGHTEIGWTKTLYFNASAATTETGAWNDTAPTSTVFSIGTSRANTSSATYVAYCFSEVEGYSKFGSYTGNGSTDGPFVYCGFRPSMIIYKNSSVSSDWTIVDAARSPYNEVDVILDPSNTTTEGSLGTTNRNIDFLSNGFKIRSTAAGGTTALNGSGNTMIFLAFAKNPFGGSGVSPATAR